MPFGEVDDEVESGVGVVFHLLAYDEACAGVHESAGFESDVSSGVLVGLEEVAEFVLGDDLLEVAAD